jgi:hypothetical protein
MNARIYDDSEQTHIRLESIIASYLGRTEDKAVAEDKSTFKNGTGTVTKISKDPVPAVSELIIEQTSRYSRIIP